MNKYKKALDRIYTDCYTTKDSDGLDDVYTLEELVDRATPIKTSIEKDALGNTMETCEKCGKIVLFKTQSFCHHCGQAFERGK